MGTGGTGSRCHPKPIYPFPGGPCLLWSVGTEGHGGHSVTPNLSSHSHEATACSRCGDRGAWGSQGNPKSIHPFPGGPCLLQSMRIDGHGGRGVTPNPSSHSQEASACTGCGDGGTWGSQCHPKSVQPFTGGPRLHWVWEWGDMGITGGPQIHPAIPRCPLPAPPSPEHGHKGVTVSPQIHPAPWLGMDGWRGFVRGPLAANVHTCMSAHTQVSLHSHPASRAPQNPTQQRQSLCKPAPSSSSSPPSPVKYCFPDSRSGDYYYVFSSFLTYICQDRRWEYFWPVP